MTLVLLQKGPKVKGEIQASDGASMGSIEGQVKGETFSWQLTGPLVKTPMGNPPNLGPERSLQLYGIPAPVGEIGNGSLC